MSLTLTLERGGAEVSGSGTNIELDGTIAGGAIESVEMYGDTEQQTYSGKNFINSHIPPVTSSVRTTLAEVDNGIEVVRKNTSQTGAAYAIVPIQNIDRLLGQVVSYSFNVDGDRADEVMTLYGYKNGTASTTRKMGFNNTSGSFTMPASLPTNEDGYCLCFYVVTGENKKATFTNIQLELGSAPTEYEKYVGGVPSPNPDYPQEVKTVTGEQTITISDGNGQSQSYTVDLGDIELCKIGKYQDYIYKSGEDWYLHKETGKVTFTGAGTETWSSATAATGYVRFSTASGATHADNTGYCNELINRGSQSHGAYEYVLVQPNANAFYIQVLNTRANDLASFRTWLGTNPATVYYDIATATDTQITDATLIAQLDALNEATTYDGKTIITVSSENLAGSLEVTAATSIAKTYTEVEIGSPFTITDVEGKSSNTTLDGNVYVDWAYNKKQYSFDLFNLTPQDYADIRAFYDYQFNNSAFPTITVPELNIDKLPVYMEISSRNIINQCLLTDKLTIKFRETVQP